MLILWCLSLQILTNLLTNDGLPFPFCLLCRSKGIFFVAIDLNMPLPDQGPFDIVMHKVRIGYSLGTLPYLIVNLQFKSEMS